MASTTKGKTMIQSMNETATKTGLNLIQKTGSAAKARRYIVYGLPGVGKSSLAAQFPAPVFIPLEDGLTGLEVDAFPVCNSYRVFCEYLQTLINEEHGYKTVVLDSLDWLEPIIYRQVCKDNSWQNIEQPGYGKGYVVAVAEAKRVINALQMLIDKGINVVLLCHAQTAIITPPDSTEFMRYDLKLNKKLSAVFCEWADVIGYLHVAIATKDKRAIEKQRELVLDSSPAYIAKNRFCKPQKIDVSNHNFDGLAAIFPQQKT